MLLCTTASGNFSSSKVSVLIKAVKTFMAHKRIVFKKTIEITVVQEQHKADITDFLFQFLKDTSLSFSVQDIL